MTKMSRALCASCLVISFSSALGAEDRGKLDVVVYGVATKSSGLPLSPLADASVVCRYRRSNGDPYSQEDTTDSLGRVTFTIPRKGDIEILVPTDPSLGGVITPAHLTMTNPLRWPSLKAVKLQIYLSRVGDSKEHRDAREKLKAEVGTYILKEESRLRSADAETPEVTFSLKNPAIRSGVLKIVMDENTAIFSLPKGRDRADVPQDPVTAETFASVDIRPVGGAISYFMPEVLGLDSMSRASLVVPQTTFAAPASSAPLANRWALAAGFQSRYIYHGLDVIGFNSFSPYSDSNALLRGALRELFPDPNDKQRALLPRIQLTSGIAYANLNFAAGPLTLGVGLVGAVDKTVPASQLVKLLALAYGPQRTQVSLSSSRYIEWQLKADYKVRLFDWADVHLGYNAYFFPEKAFRNGYFQGEVRLEIQKTIAKVAGWELVANARAFQYHSDARLPQIQFGPVLFLGSSQLGSLTTYVSRNTGPKYLDGGYLELELRASRTVFSASYLTAGVVGTVTTSGNLGYATQGRVIYDRIPSLAVYLPGTPGQPPVLISGSAMPQVPREPRHYELNTVELGIATPFRVGGRLQIIPNCNLGIDVSRSGGAGNAFGERSLPGRRSFWWGVSGLLAF